MRTVLTQSHVRQQVSGFLLTAVLVLAATSGMAQTVPIGYYCAPYQSTFLESESYQSQGVGCHYVSPAIVATEKYGDLYRGLPGNATLISGRSLGSSSDSVHDNDVPTPPVPDGEWFFVAIYEVRAGTNDLQQFRQLFQTGLTYPPHSNYGLLHWRYGPPFDPAYYYSAGNIPSPGGITTGPDGNVWFTSGSAQIGRMTATGALTEFGGGGVTHYSLTITVGSDGNLWFFANGINSQGSAVRRISPSGTVTSFPVPFSFSAAIATGSDGNLWFADSQQKIGRLTVNGEFTQFDLSLPLGTGTAGITSGPDGNLWFAVRGFFPKIGRISPTGQVTYFGDGLSADSNPQQITTGPDGNLWFTDSAGGRIGKVTPAGTITEFQTRFANSEPHGIAAGPDGKIWFTELRGARIGRMTTEGVHDLSINLPLNAQPWGVTAGPDGHIWFTELSPPLGISRIGKILVGNPVGPPVCRLTASPNRVLLGNSASLVAECDPPALTYNWTLAAGLLPGSFNSATVTPPSAGVHLYSVSGTNPVGTGNLAVVAVEVVSPLEETPASQQDLKQEDLCNQASAEDKAVIITHGWHAEATEWPTELALKVCSKLGTGEVCTTTPKNDHLTKICQVSTATGVWHVWVLDWDTNAWGHPKRAHANAKGIGENLAAVLKGKHYSHIHLIAHSAGANLIDTSSRQLREWIQSTGTNLKLHQTFLDAYDPAQDPCTYGKASDWADNYVDTRQLLFDGVDGTRLLLPNAYNVDVTPEGGCIVLYTDFILRCRHSRPYRFYGRSVDDNFHGDGLSLFDAIQGTDFLGYPLSVEGGSPLSTLNTAYPKGKTCAISSTTCQARQSVPSCNSTVGLVSLSQIVASGQLGSVSYSLGGTQTSTPATVFNTLQLDVTGQPSMSNALGSAQPAAPGSTAWITVQVSTTNPVNILRFNLSFANGGEGLLRIYVNDLPVRTIDQRYVPATLYEEVFIGGEGGTLPPGTHKIAFRLDGFGPGPSSVVLANVDVGLRQIQANLSRLFGISTRVNVLTGDNVMIGGFIVDGPSAKTVVVRARGPSLGVAGQMVDPTMTIVPAAGGPNLINDDWGTAANAETLSTSGFAPGNANESAILATLNPGAYTAIVGGVGNTTGVALVEVYEMDQPTTPLVGISTRGLVQTGDNVMIGGFIIQGDGPQTVVIRARGPSLGVAGALADPTMTIVPAGGGALLVNDDWETDPRAPELAASGYAPGNPKESAILVTLNPGAYTAIVSGVGGTTGVAIVEVYDVP
jgi:streptogramin lyase